MSGHIPDFIKRNAEVVVDGQREVVKDYFTTNGGGHNSDTLVLRLKSGKSIEFDYDRVKPETAQKSQPARKSEAEITAERLEILRKKRPPSSPFQKK